MSLFIYPDRQRQFRATELPADTFGPRFKVVPAPMNLFGRVLWWLMTWRAK